MPEMLHLNELAQQDIPAQLRPGTYFDFQAHPFEHQALFESGNVLAPLAQLADYIKQWQTPRFLERCQGPLIWKPKARWGTVLHGSFKVYAERDAVFSPRCIVAKYSTLRHNRLFADHKAEVFGADFYLEKGEIFIGPGARIEAGAVVHGPAIIGEGCTIRSGALVRGPVVLGKDGVFGGELKNVVAMDRSELPHHGYCGDSICGYAAHCGNQVTAANYGLFQGFKAKEEKQTVQLKIDGAIYETGLEKLGAVLGDQAQVGCSTVLDPGTLLGPRCVVYPLTRLPRGCYAAGEIIKNKPMEHGVLERLRPERT